MISTLTLATQVHNRQHGERRVVNSPTFPMVEKGDLYRFLEHAKQDEIAAEIEFRAWVKDKLT